MGIAPHDMHTDYIEQKITDLFPNQCKMSRNNIYNSYCPVKYFAFSFSQIMCIRTLQQD